MNLAGVVFFYTTNLDKFHATALFLSKFFFDTQAYFDHFTSAGKMILFQQFHKFLSHLRNFGRDDSLAVGCLGIFYIKNDWKATATNKNQNNFGKIS